jgi:hypothetical protein
MDGKQIKLRAELDVKGLKRPVRWACDHPTNPDGSLTIRLKKELECSSRTYFPAQPVPAQPERSAACAIHF